MTPLRHDWSRPEIEALFALPFLAARLPPATRDRFFIWNGIGLVVYLLYGRVASRLAKRVYQAG